MSHWAEIDSNNKVIRVLVGDNNDPAGDEGYQWLLDNFGGTWVKTSYNKKIRYNFAGLNHFYDEDNDAFIAPQPYPSWSLDEQFTWQPPIPMPDKIKTYKWVEELGNWVEALAE